MTHKLTSECNLHYDRKVMKTNVNFLKNVHSWLYCPYRHDKMKKHLIKFLPYFVNTVPIKGVFMDADHRSTD